MLKTLKDLESAEKECRGVLRALAMQTGATAYTERALRQQWHNQKEAQLDPTRARLQYQDLLTTEEQQQAKWFRLRDEVAQMECVVFRSSHVAPSDLRQTHTWRDRRL
jgi:hypothetical protein